MSREGYIPWYPFLLKAYAASISAKPHAEENMLRVATNTDTISEPVPLSLEKWHMKTACSVEGPDTASEG